MDEYVTIQRLQTTNMDVHICHHR